MRTWAKYLAGLALALPMGAYVAGSLMASASDEPGNREPVRISDQPSAPRTTEGPRDAERSTGPGRTPAQPEHDAHHDDTGEDDDVDDNGVRVVTPQPTRLDDGDDDGEDGVGDGDGDDDDDSEDRDDSRDDGD